MTRSRLLAVALLALALGACRTELYDGLSQRDANAMVAALARAGIEATREEVEPGTFRVMVPEEDLAAAVEALERVGLPRESFQSLGEIFPGDGLIVSPYEQRVRTMFALNQEIAQTVSMIDGVINARVHVVLPDLDLRGQPLNRPSASIVVQHRPDIEIEDLGSRIRLVVANAVQGLTYRDVAVAFFPLGGAAPVAEARVANASARPSPLLAEAAPAPGPSASLSTILLWVGALALFVAGAGVWLRDRQRARAPERLDVGSEA